MSPCRCILVAALFLALNNVVLLAKGEKIVLHFKTGQQMAGELHSVSDSSLVVYKLEEETLQLFEVKSREIEKVTFKSRPKVVLFLKDGQRVTGGLHEVRDSSLVIYSRAQGKEQKNGVAHVEISSEVKNQEIQQIIIKGKKNAGKGRAIGFGLGFLTGVVIGLAEGDDPPCPPPPESKNIFELLPNAIAHGIANGLCESFRETAGDKAMSYGSALGLAGLTAGWIVGKATSTRDMQMEFPAAQPFAVLKPLALRTERLQQKKSE